MNLSVGYLDLVLLALVYETVLGNPVATTSNSAESSSDSSTISNANAVMLANNYDDVQGEQVKGCVLNGAVYQNGDVNTDLCMHTICNNGAWEYTGQMNKECGNCTVHGSQLWSFRDPYFWTFDDTKDLPYGHKYEFGEVGSFVITQNGMKSPSFELNANFDACYFYHPEYFGNQSCVRSITYRELGIAVQLVIPSTLLNKTTEQIAEIEVLVNGEVQKLSNDVKSAEAFSGTDGTVLVFEHNYVEEEVNFFCMNIIGSQGLSMSLCKHDGKFARLYVLPMKTLKNELYGLCNTYTGAPQKYLIARYGVKQVKTINKDIFTHSWRSSCAEVGGRCQDIHDTCNGVIDRGLGCNQQICCIERKGCVLDNIPYEDGAFNDNTCMVMQCRNGAWEFTGQNRDDCGNCTVTEGAHFSMFDNTTFLPPPGNEYQFGVNGTYVITQNGLRSSPSFGLNATFEMCNTDHSSNLTCVKNICYYEPGLTVEVHLPVQATDTTFAKCTRLGHNPSTDPNCQFKVKIDDEEVQPTGRAMNIQAKYGSVVIFTHNHIEGDANLFCMDIVGSRGLSVSLCQHESNFSWLYVLPMQTLKPKQTLPLQESILYGLCNTYTGLIQDHLTENIVDSPTSLTSFIDSWKVKFEITTQNISQEE